jgi:hypothetical protein
MELIEGVYASDFTKKTLYQFGWTDGAAIPAELGALMLEMKASVPSSTRTDVLIDKEKMTQEQIDQITSLLKQAVDYAARKKKNEDLDEKTKTMAPSVAAAYKKIVESEPEIIDDRNDPAPLAKEEEKPATEAEEKPEPVSSRAVENQIPVTAFCPRCGWDVRMKFDVVPTDRDKEDFLATLLGGTRFRKRYELFGGKVVVTFRSVLAEENKLIYRQLVLDQQNGTVNTEAEWFVQLMDYRLACALDTIADKSGKVLASAPELDMTGSTKEKTPLVDQLDLINKNILAQEATRRLVGMHLRQFQRLIEAIEAMAVEPSFWNGIE